MKNILCKISGCFAGIVSILFLSACSTPEPVRFGRYFDSNGICYEIRECGNNIPAHPATVVVPGSVLERFLKSNPAKKKSTVKDDRMVCLAFFFGQGENYRSFGTGPADKLSSAAFFAESFPKSKQEKIASEIRTILLTRDETAADKLYDRLALENPSGPVRSETIWYDPEDRANCKSYCEFSVNEKKERIPYGLQRYYHENGMIREEYYLRDGKKTAECKYSPLGKLETTTITK